MRIYLVEQTTNPDYDVFESIVVAAESDQEAIEIPPTDFITHVKDGKWMGTDAFGTEYIRDNREWVPYSDIDKLKVTLIGIGIPNLKKGVIHTSFRSI